MANDSFSKAEEVMKEEKGGSSAEIKEAVRRDLGSNHARFKCACAAVHVQVVARTGEILIEMVLFRDTLTLHPIEALYFTPPIVSTATFAYVHNCSLKAGRRSRAILLGAADGIRYGKFFFERS